jgi:hypothetical protein
MVDKRGRGARQDRGAKALRWLFWLTVTVGAVPFALYYWQRYTGALPSPAEWLAQGYNHGPWRWQLEGFTVAYPVLVLGFLTLATGVAVAIRRREIGFLAWALALAALQGALVIGQLAVIGAAID